MMTICFFSVLIFTKQTIIGKIPPVSAGTVRATGCVTRERECCVLELPLLVRNCSADQGGHVVYRLTPAPACNMGYCVGEGVPCPNGMASVNGYSPCEFSVKMVEVLLSKETEDDGQTVFYCAPMLSEVLDPRTLSLSVEWTVDGIRVKKEDFSLMDRAVGSLRRNEATRGRTVRCSARASHSVVGSKTQWKHSDSIAYSERTTTSTTTTTTKTTTTTSLPPTTLAPPAPLVLVEGGPPADMVVRLPSSSPRRCLNIRLKVDGEDDTLCPFEERIMSSRISLPKCAIRACADDSGQFSAVHIPVRAMSDHLVNSESQDVVHIRMDAEWAADRIGGASFGGSLILPSQEVQIVNALPDAVCSVSPTLTKFGSEEIFVKIPGVYSVYRSAKGPTEVQAHFRSCSLGPLCTCAVSVRYSNFAVVADACTKGHLQVWAWQKQVEGVRTIQNGVPEGFRLLSIDEGREFKVVLPTDEVVTLSSMLTRVTIRASENQQHGGLCSTNGEVGAFELDQEKNLFAGHFGILSNSTDGSSFQNDFYRFCKKNCRGSCDLDDALSFTPCLGGEDYLDQAIKLGISRDFKAYTNLLDNPELLLSSEEEEDSVEDKDIAQIFLSNRGPQQEAPSDGWTMNTADKYCSDLIRESAAAHNCRNVKGVDVASDIANCRTQLLFTGDSRVASLHLDKLKRQCKEQVFTNTKLWESDVASDFARPPRRVTDALCLNSCSSRGVCDRGECKCDDGFSGSDCSQQTTRKPPRVSALSNFGLCDVRASPCREVVVLGDGLVADPQITCSYEIYRIRGVASKHLVNDGIIDVPANFVSYQQVICPLPELNIHQPDEITNFDLKENIDHTRVFAKVSLSYGNSNQTTSSDNNNNNAASASSAPLDLLLYDSLCWDCSSHSGECKANTKEARCFFLAGTAVFRISGNAASSSSSSSSSPMSAFARGHRACALPKDSGGCHNKIFRYYYNAIERRCKLFVYGGCKGNANNFLSEVQCLQQCGDEAQLALLPVEEQATTEIDTCSQVRDEGICPGNVPRFYFNKELGRCDLFSYGGCGGNTNNFETQEECVAHCGGPIVGVFHQTVGEVAKPRKSLCNLPVNKGSCPAKLRRFHFDSSIGTCKLFIFGGCQGNANNFETMEECLDSCLALDSFSSAGYFATFNDSPRFTQAEAPPESKKPELASPQSASLTADVSSSELSVDVLPNGAEVCQLPKSFGTCLTVTFRYYFDPKDNACRRFRYSGCGGNANNFLSADDCVRTCGGLLAVDRRAPDPKVSPRILDSGRKSATNLQGHKDRLIQNIASSLQSLKQRAEVHANTSSSNSHVAAVPTINSQKTGVRTTTIATTIATTATTASPAADSEDRRKNIIRGRIKQRKRLFSATRNRFVPSSTTTSTTTTTPPTPASSPSTPSTSVTTPVLTLRRSRTRSRSRFQQPREDSKGNEDVQVQTSRAEVVRARTVESDIVPEKPRTTAVDDSLPPRARTPHRFQLSESVQRLIRARASSSPSQSKEVEASAAEEDKEERTKEQSAVTGSRSRFRPASSSGRQLGLRGSRERQRERTKSQLSQSTPTPTPSSSPSPRAGRLRVDQVVPAPPSMSDSSLVVIRNYCRFPPTPQPDTPRCRRDGQPLYYYDLGKARCVPFAGGYCGRSRNRFLSEEACMEACVVKATSLEDEGDEEGEER